MRFSYHFLSMNLIIHIDGGSRGNPGPAAAGVVIHDADSGRVVHEAGYLLGRATNNVAEYQGLIRALKLAIQMGARSVDIRSDSQLMVRQITGDYRVKSPDLAPLCKEAQTLLLTIDTWQLRDVRRHENARADELANLALDRGGDLVLSATAGDAPNGPEASAENSTRVTAPSASPVRSRDELEHDDPRSPGRALTAPALSAVEKPSPQWTVQFTSAPPPAICPAPCGNHQRYTFGPQMPAGLCVHAAAVILDEGPLVWDDPAQQRDRTWCPRCKAEMLIERAADPDQAADRAEP